MHELILYFVNTSTRPSTEQIQTLLSQLVTLPSYCNLTLKFFWTTKDKFSASYSQNTKENPVSMQSFAASRFSRTPHCGTTLEVRLRTPIRGNNSIKFQHSKIFSSGNTTRKTGSGVISKASQMTPMICYSQPTKFSLRMFNRASCSFRMTAPSSSGTISCIQTPWAANPSINKPTTALARFRVDIGIDTMGRRRLILRLHPYFQPP